MTTASTKLAWNIRAALNGVGGDGVGSLLPETAGFSLWRKIVLRQCLLVSSWEVAYG